MSGAHVEWRDTDSTWDSETDSRPPLVLVKESGAQRAHVSQWSPLVRLLEVMSVRPPHHTPW